MNRKIIYSVLLSVFAFASVVGTVQAQTTTPSATGAAMREKMQEKREARKEARTENTLERLKNKANKEIERRIKALTHLITVINKFKKVSATQKATLTAQVQAEIDSLTALRAKINADTSIEALRTDKQSIIKSYRIFAFFIPKIHIMANAERLLVTVEKATTLADNLEKRIAEEQAKGKDVTALQASLTSMRTYLAQAKTSAESALTTASALTLAGYPANKTELKKARTLLRTAHEQLVLARKDGQKIKQGLGVTN